jgi:hypothetical protein
MDGWGICDTFYIQWFVKFYFSNLYLDLLEFEINYNYKITVLSVEEKQYSSTHSSRWHQMDVNGQHHTLASLHLGKNPGTH